MSVPEIFEINKTEAAGCQIDTAIELFFENRDAVSILSLTYSAWGIVKNLLNDKHDSIRKRFADDQKVRFGSTERDSWEKLDSFWNYLKHAKNDPDKSFQFPSGYAEASLFAAVHDFAQVFPVTSETMDAYYFWWLAKNEQMLLGKMTVEEKKEVNSTFLAPRKQFPGIAQADIAGQKNMGYKSIQALRGRQQSA